MVYLKDSRHTCPKWLFLLPVAVKFLCQNQIIHMAFDSIDKHCLVFFWQFLASFVDFLTPLHPKKCQQTVCFLLENEAETGKECRAMLSYWIKGHIKNAAYMDNKKNLLYSHNTHLGQLPDYALSPSFHAVHVLNLFCQMLQTVQNLDSFILSLNSSRKTFISLSCKPANNCCP